jgi:hypothetical protein
MTRSPSGGAPGIGKVDVLVSDLPIPRPVQLRLTPPEKKPVNPNGRPVNIDMDPSEAHELGMALINAADQARARRSKEPPARLP